MTKEERAQSDEQLYAVVERYLERLLGPQEKLEPLTLEREDDEVLNE